MISNGDFIERGILMAFREIKGNMHLPVEGAINREYGEVGVGGDCSLYDIER